MKETRTWSIDETKLSENDKKFFEKQGILKETKESVPSDDIPTEKDQTGIDFSSKIGIMMSLRTIDYRELNDSIKIRILLKLASPIADDRDFDIPFEDFCRISNINDIVDRESYLNKVIRVIEDDGKDKEKLLDDYYLTPIEKALFKYEWQ